MSDVVLSVRSLRIEVQAGFDIVDEVSFDLLRGEVLGLVGESGCGKTAVAMALLNHARPGTRIARGQVLLGGADLLSVSGRALRRIRGSSVSYVPQDPTRSLNPRHRVIGQIEEVLRVHGLDPRSERARIESLLDAVNLPSDSRFLRRFPHQLSGGQQQRIVLVMALACQPAVVVLDEPTTGLDVTTQARVLEAVASLRSVTGASFLHVTHDLAVVGNLADRIAVMYAGRVVELGPTARLLQAAAHPYTARLLTSTPRIHDPSPPQGLPGTAPAPNAKPSGCFFAPRCPLADAACTLSFPPVEQLEPGHFVRCFRWEHTSSLAHGGFSEVRRANGRETFLAVDALSAGYGRGESFNPALVDVSFSVSDGECLAVVGESGSGKTTLARCIGGSHLAYEGSILLGDRRLAPDARRRTPEERRLVQLIYQNPDRSLNPRRTVGDQIARPLVLFRLARGKDVNREVGRLLERVRLPLTASTKYPPELSGGEKQRVAIARALAAQPRLLLCDEVTSSLDVSVQAAVLELLAELRVERGLSMLYISHDLGVVATIADRVLVLKNGVLREEGTTNEVIAQPKDEYTRELIAASPELPAAS